MTYAGWARPEGDSRWCIASVIGWNKIEVVCGRNIGGYGVITTDRLTGRKKICYDCAQTVAPRDRPPIGPDVHGHVPGPFHDARGVAKEYP